MREEFIKSLKVTKTEEEKKRQRLILLQGKLERKEMDVWSLKQEEASRGEKQLEGNRYIGFCTDRKIEVGEEAK